MATDYDAISDEYRRSKLQPWRLHVETFELFELVGPLAGLQVLDLACGEGFHTRFLAQRGAARVIGVDISAGMIALAREQEASRPLGIEYHVHDVKDLDLGEQFDLVFAAYLLNYAESADELRSMTEAIARHLKPGGRFVTVNNNPDYSGETASMRPYQFTRGPSSPVEGTPIPWTFYLDDGPFEITNYQLSVATHEAALAAAGLGEVRWHRARVAPAGIAEDGEEFWRPFVTHQPIVFLECARRRDPDGGARRVAVPR